MFNCVLLVFDLSLLVLGSRLSSQTALCEICDLRSIPYKESLDRVDLAISHPKTNKLFYSYIVRIHRFIKYSRCKGGCCIKPRIALLVNSALMLCAADDLMMKRFLSYVFTLRYTHTVMGS